MGIVVIVDGKANPQCKTDELLILYGLTSLKQCRREHHWAIMYGHSTNSVVIDNRRPKVNLSDEIK